MFKLAIPIWIFTFFDIRTYENTKTFHWFGRYINPFNMATIVLFMLSLGPAILLNSLISLNASIIWFLSRSNSVPSSAYYDSLIFWYLSPCFTLKPFICVFCQIRKDKISTTITNSKDDKGHPCLTPHSISKAFNKWPLFFIFSAGFLYSVSTQLIKLYSKLNVRSVLNMVFH